MFLNKLYNSIKASRHTFINKYNSYNGLDSNYESIDNKKIIHFKKDSIIIIANNKRDYNYLINSQELKTLLNKYKLKLKVYYLIRCFNKDYLKNSEQLTIFDFIYNFNGQAYAHYKPNKKYNNRYGCVSFDSIDELDNKLSSFDGLKLFSNLEYDKCISVRTDLFYSKDGSSFLSGGAERYLLDLSDILSSKNISMNIFQNSDYPFVRKYNNVNIIGINKPSEYKNIDNIVSKNMAFLYKVYKNSQLVIYSGFSECYPLAFHPSIGISHCVWWDTKDFTWKDNTELDLIKMYVLKSAMSCDRLISVDTNTCNWFQTFNFKLANEKMLYLHNYVDLNEFKPKEDYLKEKDKLVILFPRRIVESKGTDIMIKVSEDLLKKYKNIEIHFVGIIDKNYTNKMNALIKKYPKRVLCYIKNPNEMKDVYQNSDITVIPTINSEGTSLSCLEAMACGNIVIASRIGGLANIIIDQYNGYLIEPNEISLYSALEDAIVNYNNKKQMRKNAIEVVKSFSKDIWTKRWNEVFDNYPLKESSYNNELVEYSFNSLKDIKNIDKLRKDLTNNKLIYLYIKDTKDYQNIRDKYQGPRIQIIKK